MTTSLLDAPRDDGDACTTVFLAARPQLVAVAHRVVKDPGEAEDVVQEAWLRWTRADRSAVLNPPAFLVSTTARLALNVVQSARSRRETVTGSWPFDRAEQGAGPEATAELRESVDAGLRLLLEVLTPASRAAYLLRAAFDYPYHRIALVLHLRTDHARQLVHRARRRLRTEPRRPVDDASHQRLVRTFLAAAQSGELSALERLLAEDVVDGRDATAVGIA